jgi:hypothetical protein
MTPRPVRLQLARGEWLAGGELRAAGEVRQSA